MIIKIMPDIEKARSMLRMSQITEKNINRIIQVMGLDESQSMLSREYYEVMRELASGILFIDGLKAIGENAHKEIIDSLSKYHCLTEHDIMEIQDLRIRRNKNSYEGKPIESPYLENKIEKFENIIKALKKLLKSKLGISCIIIRGPLGIGKTTIAKMLAKELDAEHFSIDSILEQEGLDKIDKKEGCIPLGNFIKANEKIIPKIKELLFLNKNIIIEGNFYYKEQLENLIKALEGEKVNVFTLKAKLSTCIERDKKRQKPYGKLAAEAIYKLVSKFDFGKDVDTENKTEKEVVEEIKKELG